jgi:hypothetical protein
LEQPQILKNLSTELQEEFGKGFGERNLRNFRQFYLTFRDAEFGTQRMPNLTWSHIKLIMRLTDKNAMQYYLTGHKTLDRGLRRFLRAAYWR